MKQGMCCQALGLIIKRVSLNIWSTFGSQKPPFLIERSLTILQIWLVARGASQGKVEGGNPFSNLRRISPTWDRWPPGSKTAGFQTPSESRKSFLQLLLSAYC